MAVWHIRNFLPDKPHLTICMQSTGLRQNENIGSLAYQKSNLAN